MACLATESAFVPRLGAAAALGLPRNLDSELLAVEFGSILISDGLLGLVGSFGILSGARGTMKA